jgi:hypothetical protein
MEVITDSIRPRGLYYSVRAQTAHSVGGNLEPAKLLTLDIPFSTSNINFSKFTGKLMKITVVQLDLHDWDGAGIGGDFDGIQFSLNVSQPYGQTNDYDNPYSVRPNNSLIFLGAGELLSGTATFNVFTFRVPSIEEGVIVYFDGSPLQIRLTDWLGAPFTTGLDCGFIGVNSWWSILLRIEPLN